MIRFLFISLLVCLCLTVKSQSKRQHKSSTIDLTKFTGIGIFKINTDTSLIVDYVKNNYLEEFTIDNHQSLKAIKEENETNILTKDTIYNAVYSIAKNSYKADDINTHNCPLVKQYFINRYKVAGISFQDVMLTYYQNKLVLFECKNSDEIEDAMKQKYGAGFISHTEETIHCLYHLTGNVVDQTAKTFTIEWKNGPLSALTIIGSYYDDNCQLQRYTLFQYSVYNAIEKCDNEHTPVKKPIMNNKQIKEF